MTENNPHSSSEPLYFSVSPKKLVIMSVCTSGLYEVYWFYQNWCLIEEREKSDIMPVMRGLFSVFFCYSLFCKIRDTAKENNIPIFFQPALTATVWVLITILEGLPEPYGLIALTSSLNLLPVQRAINSINGKLVPTHDANQTFSKTNIAVILIFLYFTIRKYWPFISNI